MTATPPSTSETTDWAKYACRLCGKTDEQRSDVLAVGHYCYKRQKKLTPMKKVR